MKLSKNFSLSEFTKSATAKKENIKNTPSERQIKNIEGLVNDFLQPLRDHFKKPIKVTSGYRSKVLNEKVGGATKSYHRCLGNRAAADFKIPAPIKKAIFTALGERDQAAEICRDSNRKPMGK